MGREEFGQPVETTTQGRISSRRDFSGFQNAFATGVTSGSVDISDENDLTLLLDVSAAVDINLYVEGAGGVKYEIDESPISFSSAGKKVVKWEYDGVRLHVEAADGATTFDAEIHYVK